MTEEEMKARIAELEGEVSKTDEKNKELLGKLKTAKTETETAKTAAEQAEEDAARKDGDITKLEKTLSDKYAKQIEALTADRDNALKAHRQAQVQTAIQSAFATNNVLPDAHELIETYFNARVEYADNGPVIDGKPIGDALTDYFKSDKAKHFIAASANSGVGPKLNAGKSSPSPTDAWSIDAYAKMKNSDPVAAVSFAEANGHAYLNK